ncbi:MAG: class B sortase [Firmicutes bacterium]|nr:class B sortase [Bacillota bacterium]
MGMPAEAIGKKAVKWANSAINAAVLTVLLLFTAFAGYALWDSKQLYQAADKSQYEIFKPTAENEGRSFQELRALNAEVFAWLSVYGTNIDYPVTQGQDNMKYVNTNAQGLYSLSGSIFLDCRNRKDFSDFNNILYGHHMEKKTMFGEIGNFADKGMFESRRYGNLYFGGKDHGVEFFAFVHTDAYDSTVFTANIKGEARRAWLEGLLAKAVHERDIGVTTEDNIILLSTCSSASTNGRDILAGRITDGLFEDTFTNAETNNWHKPVSADSWAGLADNLPRWLLALIPLLLSAVSVLLLLVIRNRRKQHGKEAGKK